MKEKIITYVKETQAELKQVTWPTKTELIGSTWATIFVTFLLAIFIYLVDKVLETSIVAILSLKR